MYDIYIFIMILYDILRETGYTFLQGVHENSDQTTKQFIQYQFVEFMKNRSLLSSMDYRSHESPSHVELVGFRDELCDEVRLFPCANPEIDTCALISVRNLFEPSRAQTLTILGCDLRRTWMKYVCNLENPDPLICGQIYDFNPSTILWGGASMRPKRNDVYLKTWS